ncbi:PilZ domain-containing protein [Methylobacterium sp. J-090]|uniref:PilZ domain-containing protein n=1 Tax=Methylobacterium sp. J-090 TaxID=2836666 RepID=UPI001FB937F7|nr:PilZ domain-containing protein [Methylobacterium sp. J-090]MCJ2083944.1 PilZ domain-containing protein [Methylobacterium sp. J-090]
MRHQHAKPHHHTVVVPALCWGRDRSEFYAVTDIVSPDGIHFRSATTPLVDEELTCNIRHIGAVETRVVSIGGCAFVVRLLARRQAVASIARELRLLSEQQEATVPVRAHPRVTPLKTDVTIELADGRIVPAKLLNISASGVAFTLDAHVAIGASITIGRTAARVARHFEHGVGAVFDTAFDPQAFDQHITL